MLFERPAWLLAAVAIQYGCDEVGYAAHEQLKHTFEVVRDLDPVYGDHRCCDSTHASSRKDLVDCKASTRVVQYVIVNDAV